MNETGLSLYIHIPFCLSKCLYCDFNSYSGKMALIPAYVAALTREVAYWGETAERPLVSTIYLGGGTPSLLTPAQVGKILDACRRGFVVDRGAEISIEVNPGTVSEAHFGWLINLGVNRVSLGFQSLDDGDLKTLGRAHSAAEAVAAYQTARRTGLDNLNIDLIYNLPNQTLARWRADLEGAAALAPEHLSLYPLTLEAETPLGQRVAQGKLSPPDEDVAAEMYLWAEDFLASLGFTHYEISNWARPGKECRHNLVYWENRPYLGLGAGAHSFWQGRRFSNLTSPEEYIAAIESSRGAVAEAEALDEATQVAETIILGLRLDRGIDWAVLARRFGREIAQFYQPQVEELVEWGLMEETRRGIRLTQRGRLLGNEVFARFLNTRLTVG